MSTRLDQSINMKTNKNVDFNQVRTIFTMIFFKEKKRGREAQIVYWFDSFKARFPSGLSMKIKGRRRRRPRRGKT